MALDAAFYPGSVDKIEWSTWAANSVPEWVDGYAVTQTAGDRTVSVAVGAANVGGVLIRNDAAMVVQAAANGSANPRIDRLILRSTWSSNTPALVFKQGTPAAIPQPPALTRTKGVLWETSLARVQIGPGQGALLSGDITSERTPPPPGFFYLTSLSTAPDTTDRALIYYSATDSLRVGTPEGYMELADHRPVSWVTVNATAPWSGPLHYARVGRHVYVRGEASRSTGGLDGSLMATLPAAVRPSKEIDVVGWQNTAGGRRVHAMAVQANGQISVYPGTDVLAAGLVLRFTATYPVGG